MNGDIPDLSSPIGLNNKYDDADNYFGKSIIGLTNAGLTPSGSENAANNFFNRSTFPASRVDRETTQSKAHDSFNYGNVGPAGGSNLFTSPGTNLHLSEHDNSNWSTALTPDNRKVNGTSNVFDAFSHPKSEHNTIGMDFNALPNSNKSTAFGNELLKMNYTDGPPGFSQAKKSAWPCSAQSSNTIKNGFPSVSPLSSDNILSNSSVDDPRPGSTASSGRITSSSGFGSHIGNWGTNNLNPYGFMDFSTINGYSNNSAYLIDINEYFKSYIEKKLLETTNKCQQNFHTLMTLLKKNLTTVGNNFHDNDVILFQRMLNSLKTQYEKYENHKIVMQENYRKLEYVISRTAKIIQNEYVGDTEKTHLKSTLLSVLDTGLDDCTLEANNDFFFSYLHFYDGLLFNYLPTELLPHITVIRQLANKKSNEPTEFNEKAPTNPGFDESLLRSYKTFVEELDKHRTKKMLKDLNNNKNSELGPNHHNDANNGSNTGAGPNDTNNIYNNRLQPSTGSSANGNKEFDTKSCESADLPVFYNIEQLKNDPSIYMLYYYPVDSKMLNFDGVIPQIFADKCNNNTNNNVFNPNTIDGQTSATDEYQPIGRQVVQSIIDNELSKHKPGNVVFEDVDDENVCNKKSFVKLLNRLHIHFPNLEKKQLAEIVIQSKYALVKKDRYHYGFSGMKMKDIVRSVGEFIQENAIYNTNHEQSKASGSSSSRNGQVSWSKIASSTATPAGNGAASSGSMNGQCSKIDEMDRCSSLSPSQCSDRSAGNQHNQSSQYCEQAPINNSFNNRKAFNTTGQCNQMFHNMA